MSSNARRLSVAFDESKIDAIFAELNQCYLPGAAVGIAIGGKPVYRKGFGLANMEMPLLLKPSMRLRIGSTTKHFTCLAYLLLCEAGEAGIDDPLGKHLPELHPVTHKVTMRQLMGNLSGLRDSMAIRGVFGGHAGAGLRQVPTTEILALYRTIDDVNIAPGLNWIYNNAGFGLVSAVIERITGQTFAQVMWESVFQPLGMYDSLVRHWDNDFVSNCAAGHDIVCEDTWNKARFGFSYEGAGAIVSTVDDMLLWLANMDAHEVGDASTWEVMRTPQRLANGISSRYGLGLWIEPYRGVQTIHHGGGYVGFKTQMLKVPAVGLDVVVMGNRDDLPVDSLVEKILDACIEHLDSVKALTPSHIPCAKGVFRSPTSGRVVQLLGEDGQQLAMIDGLEAPAERRDPHMLWLSGERMIALRGDPARPTSIRFSDFGNMEELTAVPQAKTVDAKVIVGRYWSESTGTEAVIRETEYGLHMRTLGRFGSRELGMTCIAERIWRVKSVDFPAGVLAFAANVAEFYYSDCFNRKLTFKRVLSTNY